MIAAPITAISSELTAVFSKRVTIMCDDDEESIRVAKQMVDRPRDRAMARSRKIATFEPEAASDMGPAP